MYQEVVISWFYQRVKVKANWLVVFIKCFVGARVSSGVLSLSGDTIVCHRLPASSFPTLSGLIFCPLPYTKGSIRGQLSWDLNLLTRPSALLDNTNGQTNAAVSVVMIWKSKQRVLGRPLHPNYSFLLQFDSAAEYKYAPSGRGAGPGSASFSPVLCPCFMFGSTEV